MVVEVKQPWDDRRLQQDRLKQVQAQMKEEGIGALYITETHNVYYILNVHIPGSEVFVPVEGQAIAFVRPRDVGYVSRQYEHVRPPFNRSSAGNRSEVEEAGKRRAAGMADLMAEFGLRGERLGLDHSTAGIILSFLNNGLNVVDGLPAVEVARSVKTEDEVLVYRWIGQQYEHTFRAFRDAVRPGITELELSALASWAFYEAGGEEVSQINVCAGENMNPWSRWPTRRELKEGEFVGIDFHARSAAALRGDASRTYFAGDRPSPEQAALYQESYDHLRAVTDVFRAGRTLREVIELAPRPPKHFEEQQENLNIAHDVGVTPQGYPKVDRSKPPADDVLRPNQIFAIEQYFGEVGGKMAVKLEEMVLVVPEGPPEVLGAATPFDERLLAQPVR